MQTTQKQILAAALAVVLIAAGALFLIAPVWQPQRPPMPRSRQRRTLRRSRSLSTSTRPRQRN